MGRTLEERINATVRLAKAKIFIKLLIFAIACITVAIAVGVYYKSSAIWFFPAGLTFVPVGLGCYYFFLEKKDALKAKVMIITDVNKNIVGGILTKASITQKKYSFRYMGDDGPDSFQISRGGIFNSMTEGQTYIVLFNGKRKPAADNFIEFTALETSKMEKDKLLNDMI